MHMSQTLNPELHLSPLMQPEEHLAAAVIVVDDHDGVAAQQVLRDHQRPQHVARYPATAVSNDLLHTVEPLEVKTKLQG